MRKQLNVENSVQLSRSVHLTVDGVNHMGKMWFIHLCCLLRGCQDSRFPPTHSDFRSHCTKINEKFQAGRSQNHNESFSSHLKDTSYRMSNEHKPTILMNQREQWSCKIAFDFTMNFQNCIQEICLRWPKFTFGRNLHFFINTYFHMTHHVTHRFFRELFISLG